MCPRPPTDPAIATTISYPYDRAVMSVSIRTDHSSIAIGGKMIVLWSVQKA
jgi:hypothetical protein